MNVKSFWLSRPVAACLLVGLLCGLPTYTQHAQIMGSTATGFQGQAAAVSGIAAGSSVTVANTGTIALSGGALEASALEASLAGGLSAGVSHAAMIAGGNTASAEAAVANVSLTAGGFLSGTTTIAADFVMSRVAAVCVAVGATASGQSQILGLVINGQGVVVTGAANQLVFLSDGGFVIINEQIAGASGFTVNALHVIDAIAGVNVVFGSSTIGILCGFVTSPTPATSEAPPCDFVTGGGWITGTPSGAKANFGVAGGIKNGAFWGHLNYIDHATGMHVKHTAVTGYSMDPIDPEHCRIICYDVAKDGVPAFKARVRVCDNGEPGEDDVFEIKLYNTAPPPPCGEATMDSPIYSAGGDLGGDHPGGGNIQLHRCQ
jgi:hypothetical protein